MEGIPTSEGHTWLAERVARPLTVGCVQKSLVKLNMEKHQSYSALMPKNLSVNGSLEQEDHAELASQSLCLVRVYIHLHRVLCHMGPDSDA